MLTNGKKSNKKERHKSEKNEEKTYQDIEGEISYLNQGNWCAHKKQEQTEINREWAFNPQES